MAQDIHSKEDGTRTATHPVGFGDVGGVVCLPPVPDQGKESVLQFIEGETIVSGDGYGDQVEAMPWQRRFITGAFKSGVRTAALSLPRGNAKTANAGVRGFLLPAWSACRTEQSYHHLPRRRSNRPGCCSMTSWRPYRIRPTRESGKRGIQ